jgi:protein phosphatase
VDLGKITAYEAWYHPRKNIITRAIGLDEDIDVDTYVSDVVTGDLILLCSDGLNTMLKDEEIKEVMASREDAQQICDSLVQAANEAGGHDNITVMIMEIGGT